MTSTPIATNYYQVKVGGDVAAIKGIMKAIVEADDRALQNDEPRVIDIDFIEGHTAGFERVRNDLRDTRGPKSRNSPGFPSALNSA